MKIGFDGKRATNNATGLGNYSRNAINALATSYPENDYILYSPANKYLPQLSATLERREVSLCGPSTTLGHVFPGVWRSWGVTRALKTDGIDLYHGLSGELPFNIVKSGIPSVVTIHDLIFRRHPEYYALIDREIYDYKFRKSVENATRVIAISQTTKDDIVAYYGTDPDKIDVVYQGCNPRFNIANRTPQEIADVKKIYGLPDRYIISVGSVEPRKNQLLALRSLPLLPRDISLVVVGRHTSYVDVLRRFARDNGLTDRLILIPNADFRHLPALYAGALLASYTSEAEGFGLPVIEAISCGTPVIVASGTCLEEAAGPDSPVVDPGDIEGFTGYARSIIEEPATRQNIVGAGLLYIKKFNQATFAKGIMDTYLKALATANRR